MTPIPPQHPAETQSPLAVHVQGALAPLVTEGSKDIPALVDALLAEAHRAGTSDVHLAALRECVDVRFRIDGQMIPVASLPNTHRDLVTQRLKVMAKLVVYQAREPQDGRIDTEIGGERVSLRASFLPTLHGERVVIRFPDPKRGEIALSEIGMSDAMLADFQHMLDRPQGAALLTGPASSGKTTTIYSALRWLVDQRGNERNIMTIEDPIEAEIEGVAQSQIDLGAEFDFPEGLRAVMRQDPNIVVVGEIRDSVTARTAIQAALSGHLLIATVHAGTAPGVFMRLAQMDVERYLLATAVTGVLNQRLARRVCPDCSREIAMDETLIDALGITGEVREGAGCEACNGTGCRGRVGIFELLTVTPAIHEALLTDLRESAVAALAHSEGQGSLADDLRLKLRRGLIPPREGLRLMG